MRSTIALLCILLFSASHAYGQQKDTPKDFDPRLTDYNFDFARHRTADTAFWLWTAANYASNVAEVEITQSCLHSGRCTHEINPLLGSNRAQAYAVSMAVTTFATYLSYRWKRQNERTVAAGMTVRPAWWVPQLVTIGGHGIGIGLTFALRGPKL